MFKYSNAILDERRRLFMAYKINESCISCGACAGACPMNCIAAGEKYVIDAATCIDCGTCAGVCPVGAPNPADE